MINKQIRKALKATGLNGYQAVFIDKLKSGRRSVKVVGWSIWDYRKAAMLLEPQGYKCEIRIQNQNTYAQYVSCARLHVWEK